MKITQLSQTASEFDAMWRQGMEVAQRMYEELQRAEKPTLRQFDLLFAAIEQVSAPASLFSNVHPDKAVRDFAEHYEQLAQKLATTISLDSVLYKQLCSIDSNTMSQTEKRLHERMIRDFRRAGVDKSEDDQKQIAALRAELVEIGQTFEKNIREDVRSISVDSLEGLPEDYIQGHAPGPDGKITITTDYPDLKPFMAYAKNAEARRELFLKFNTRAFPVNESVLKSLVHKRYELAQLLGYASWADYVTEDKMIGTSAAVHDFIEKIDAIARPKGQEDYAMLLAEKQREYPEATKIEEWENSYWQESVKRRLFSFDSQQIRPYFEYTRVRDGLLALTAKLFELDYKKLDVHTWHESVEVYDVYRDGQMLGRMYFDMHPRDNKYKHAAQFTLQSGIAGVQLPEGVLVCNFADPSVSSPALMDHDQVTTFFHEFGHLLHHVLGGNQEFVSFSGVATEWDFVEAPSQLFEEWAMNTEALQTFAFHVESGEPIPAALVDQMRAADEFGKGLFARRQMVYAALSLNCYRKDPKTFEIHDLAVEMQNYYGQFPYELETQHECSFGHLDGYSAIYYTYMWSLVIAKDLLSKFEEGGMLNVDVARSYRMEILEPGGSVDAAELAHNFLGRPYSFEAFAKWLSR